MQSPLRQSDRSKLFRDDSERGPCLSVSGSQRCSGRDNQRGGFIAIFRVTRARPVTDEVLSDPRLAPEQDQVSHGLLDRVSLLSGFNEGPPVDRMANRSANPKHPRPSFSGITKSRSRSKVVAIARDHYRQDTTCKGPGPSLRCERSA
jgi:hypothetical protein